MTSPNNVGNFWVKYRDDLAFLVDPNLPGENILQTDTYDGYLRGADSAAVLGDDLTLFTTVAETTLLVTTGGDYFFGSDLVDDYVGIWVDGVLLTSTSGAGTAAPLTSINLGPGNHTIQIVYAQYVGPFDGGPVGISGPDYVGIININDADIQAGREADFIAVGGGDDIVSSDEGDDTVFGEGGNDTLDGQSGNDYISGGDGNDSLTGGLGNDTIDGGNGDDTIDGGDGSDTIDGGNGNDVIDGGADNDTILMSRGSDTIDGGTGTDVLQANAGPGVSYTFIGTEAGDQAGRSVSSAGDVDGDGLDDLIIGAWYASGGGEAYLLFGADLAAADAADGSADGVIDLDNANVATGGGFAGYQFIGTEAADVAGRSVSSAGDVDGDGLADLIIGANSADGGGGNSGEAYLLFGSDLAVADAADGSTDGVIDLDNANVSSGGGFAGYQFIGTEGSDSAGISVSSAGDVDGDGFDDLIIGAINADGGGSNSGEAYLLFGADLAAADAADGSTDGVIDLDNANAASGGGFAGYQFIGTEGSDQAGRSVSSAGDVDGDGIADLFIGATRADGGGSNSGEAYLLFGSDLVVADAADGSIDGVIDLDNANSDLTDIGLTGYQFIGTQANDYSGWSVSSAGDVDGDGLGDLIIGAPSADGGGNYSGEAYVLFGADLAVADAADGSADGVIDFDNANVATGGGFAGYQFIGTEAGDQAGLSVSSAGDVDGDGLDDLIIGAPSADEFGGASGEAYLLFGADLAAADAADGSIDGVIDLDNANEATGGGFAGYQFIGAEGSDAAATSVSSAGDVDGDGLDDLIIGADGADGGGSGSGEAYLLLGSDLAAADAADGTVDGVIDLGLTAGVGIDSDNSITVTVDNTGSGTAVQTDIGTATLTSVESFIANEVDGETDSITITDTVVDGAKVDPTGTLFDVADVSGLDDNAVGTFTPANGDPVIDFGPSEAQQLSDILALRLAGQIQIADGDESGTVGAISFENFEEINFGITCFVRGTLIRTRRGEIRIEDLAVGDNVLTADAGEQPIRWIGSRKLDARALQSNPKLRPTRIRANALAPGLPEHDLSVSPQHRVLVRSVIAERMFGSREVLIPANKLLVLPGIEIDDSAAEVEYFHMLFDAHQIVWSNGALTESLFTGPEALKGLSVEARTEITLLFPEIVEPRYRPESARFIPQKGKQMKVLAARIAKHGKPVTEMRFSG
ncbi:Hint domain-containing protein [Anianabacter salinae]|uniref:Hint domain-containing protein n=1 Tax=Anianabacter salinae TaxID=2851023 RepID=UPI00225E26FB|nr:Hint domain-containing protein [Anianabacter salinae]MBV0914226.1 Hint domain-containing protein [Anianabacter salinae]